MTFVLDTWAAEAARDAVKAELRKPRMTHERAAQAAYDAVMEAGRQQALAEGKIATLREEEEQG